MSPKPHGLQNTRTMFAGAWAQPAPKQGDPCFAGNGLSFPQRNYGLGPTPENQEHTGFGLLSRYRNGNVSRLMNILLEHFFKKHFISKSR